MRWLVLVAGPNGAGKSSFAPRFLESLKVLDPDRVARTLSPVNPSIAAIAAGRAALAEVDSALVADQSFAVETTFSGKGYLARLRAAKHAGWKIAIFYVGLDSPDLAIQRVRMRVAAGGHGVAADDIRRRYIRSLENLQTAAPLADLIEIYDNSGPPADVRLVGRIEAGRLSTAYATLPTWLHPFLSKLPIG